MQCNAGAGRYAGLEKENTQLNRKYDGKSDKSRKYESDQRQFRERAKVQTRKGTREQCMRTGSGQRGTVNGGELGGAEASRSIYANLQESKYEGAEWSSQDYT